MSVVNYCMNLEFIEWKVLVDHFWSWHLYVNRSEIQPCHHVRKLELIQNFWCGKKCHCFIICKLPYSKLIMRMSESLLFVNYNIGLKLLNERTCNLVLLNSLLSTWRLKDDFCCSQYRSILRYYSLLNVK